MNRRPLVAISCSWIAGIALPSLCPGQAGYAALAGAALLLLALALSGAAAPKLAFACAAALLLAYGERSWVELEKRTDSALPLTEDGGEASLHGTIVSEVVVDGDLATFRLRAEELRGGGGERIAKTAETVVVRVRLARVSEQDVAAGWSRGDSASVRGTLELPGDAGNFGAFDYREYLRKRGIFRQLAAKGAEAVDVERERPVSPILKAQRTADEFRHRIGELTDRLYPNGDAGYMKGLVAGIRADLDPVQYDQFARLGLTHVLAISGLHVGVIVFMLLKLGSLLRMTRERTLDLTIAMMPVYALATGASPSAVRACLMSMLALWLARRHALKDGLHLLLAAAVVMLAASPMLIEDISFQLSFIVTAGLILFVSPISDALPIPWKGIKGALAVAITAQIVSFPLTVYYFHSAHLLSLPTNFALVPVIGFLVMPLGLASVLLGGLWLPLGIFPATLATWLNDAVFAVVDWLNGFVGLRTVWPQPSLPWVACAYALLAAGIALLKRRQQERKEREWWRRQSEQYAEALSDDAQATRPLPRTGALPGRRPTAGQYGILAGLGICLIAWLAWGFQPAWLDRAATVSFLNVGQGDSILIRTGRGKHILVDAGGTVNFRRPGDEWKERADPYEVGRKLIVPLLLKRGVREIDALVFTHMDADHIGGAEAIIGNLPVRSLWFNGSLKDSPGAISLMRTAAARRIPVYAVEAPMQWVADPSAVIRALHPASESTPSDGAVPVRADQNDRSVVLLVSLYGRNFLLPGDLEAKGEHEVVEAEYARAAADGAARPEIDVLKAGHHGSKTSTTGLWVGFWRPREAVISVGRNNFYGHPNPGVLERLDCYGAQVWRTDLDGEIQYRISPDGSMERRALRRGAAAGTP
ncbi:ComEC/Rec2 family competence protein [Paenibacillaceae bacterium WGS1546]|uniref:ComEC/Rec2 family competence protein n=1 Tax=Cohnella sp. WGS1546 TaxID=3366810 RepID=UPI00372D55FC